MKNQPKRVALVNDLSGFGRCSLTIGLPVISAMGIQGCPVVTAILSNHVGFDRFFFDDYTERIPAYLKEWEWLGLSFDGIYTGFLGSKKQIDLMIDFIKRFGENALVLVDPVMGEDGVIPAPYTDELCEELKRLVGVADVITPNLTEAAKLSGMEYNPMPDDQMLFEMGEKLLKLGCKTAIITGIRRGKKVGNLIFSAGLKPMWVWSRFYGQPRVGTGDLFSSVVLGHLLNGKTILQSVRKASCFLEKTLRYSDRKKVPVMDGIYFEPFLSRLK